MDLSNLLTDFTADKENNPAVLKADIIIKGHPLFNILRAINYYIIFSASMAIECKLLVIFNYRQN